MKNQIQSKIKYYQGQLDKATRDFIGSAVRRDRDRVLKLISKIDTYKEVLELIKE